MIIGFTGKPQSGKSSAAKYLRDVHGFAWVNVGDTIKGMLRGFYEDVGLSKEEIHRRLFGDLKERSDFYLKGQTPRYALQTLGKEWRDLISPDLFVFAWDLRSRFAENVVADGMRYADEAGPLKARGGIIVHLIRPGTEDNGGSHVAETLQLQPDLTIVNDASLDDLYAKIEVLLRERG